MKKLLSLIAVSAMLTTISCKKDKEQADVTNVSSTYKMLLVTNSWVGCSSCGAATYDAFATTYANNPYDLCGISLHKASKVTLGTADGVNELRTFWGFTATPQAAINNNKMFQFGSSGEQNKKTLQNFVNNGKGIIAKAGVGITKTISGNTMEIKTKTVFFSDVTGQYNVGVYIVENNVFADQTTASAPILNARHNHIFRGAANGVWGKAVGSNSTKGTVVEDTYTFTLPSDVKNPDNLEVVAVIWKMSASGPIDMLNCNKN